MIMALKVVASGSASIYVPNYITVSTGKFTSMPDQVKVTVRMGNTTLEPVYAAWNKLHGVRVTYRKFESEKKTTVYDDNSVEFMATGAWRVEVEEPL